MMFDGGALKWLVAIGIVISFGLWAFRLIPWWGILVGGIALPVILLAVLCIVGIGMWMASGSH